MTDGNVRSIGKGARVAPIVMPFDHYTMVYFVLFHNDIKGYESIISTTLS